MQNLFLKVATSFITLTFAVIGGIWTATTVVLHTMDSKVADAKVDLVREMDIRSASRNVQFTELQKHLDQRFDDNQNYFDKRMDNLEKLIKRN